MTAFAALATTIRARRPSGAHVLVAAAAAVAVVLLLPPAFLVIESSGLGLGTVARLVYRPLTAQLLWHTVELTLVVTALCAVIGTGTAWLLERTDVPGRRLWPALIVIPLAIPDFVVAFGWSTVTNWIEGFHGAIFVMTLALYPFVYLPVAASLRSADPGQEEIARSLGAGALSTFFRVTLAQARRAILGGCLLVALVLFAEFGAFELVGFQTFSTEIYVEFSVAFNVPAAAALSFVLMVLAAAVVGLEWFGAGRASVARAGTLGRRAVPPLRLRGATLPALAALAALVGLAVGVPVSATVYWLLDSGGPLGVSTSSLLEAFWHTVLYSTPAAALATAMAVPVALLVVRRPGRGSAIIERSTFLALAMPSMIGFALAYFSGRYVNGFAYQSAYLLVLAYAVMFFPFALVAVRASMHRAPAEFEGLARSLGLGATRAFARVTLPLIAPGLAAGFCLVFLSAVCELTTTLILIPTGVQTLSSQFWQYQQNAAYSQAAPFALLMIGLALVPTLVLGRFFLRNPLTL